MRRTEGTQLDELMRATMIVEAIDGTIAALATLQEGDWQEEVARLEQLRAETVALARERYPNVDFGEAAEPDAEEWRAAS